MIRIISLIKKIILDSKIVINFLIGLVSTIILTIVLNLILPYGGVIVVNIGILIAIVNEIISEFDDFDDFEHYDFKVFISTIIGVVIGNYFINVIY